MTGVWQPETAGNAGFLDMRNWAVIWRVAGRGTKGFFGPAGVVGCPERGAGLKGDLRKLLSEQQLRRSHEGEGNRQQRKGNRQQATGSRQRATDKSKRSGVGEEGLCQGVVSKVDGAIAVEVEGAAEGGGRAGAEAVLEVGEVGEGREAVTVGVSG